MENWEKLIETILGKDCERNRENSIRFKEYLLKNLKLPVRVTGIEDFPWEERYVIGGFSKKEYNEMKKDNPSYTDEFDLLDIQDPNEHDDCIGKIRRISDGKVFVFGLSWLEAIDEDSSSFELLDTYSTWHCNY